MNCYNDFQTSKGGAHMQSFVFHDAIRFRLATQQDDTCGKIQVFFGVFAGVILRWIPGVALGVTFFVFSGYWQQVKDGPPRMRFWNAKAYGITMDVIIPRSASNWTRLNQKREGWPSLFSFAKNYSDFSDLSELLVFVSFFISVSFSVVLLSDLLPRDISPEADLWSVA